MPEPPGPPGLMNSLPSRRSRPPAAGASARVIGGAVRARIVQRRPHVAHCSPSAQAPVQPWCRVATMPGPGRRIGESAGTHGGIGAPAVRRAAARPGSGWARSAVDAGRAASATGGRATRSGTPASAQADQRGHDRRQHRALAIRHAGRRRRGRRSATRGRRGAARPASTLTASVEPLGPRPRRACRDAAHARPRAVLTRPPASHPDHARSRPAPGARPPPRSPSAG